MAGVTHHLFLRYCPSPVNLAFVVAGTDVSFCNNYARSVNLKHDHGMGVIAYPQYVSDFYILIAKFTRLVHPGWQAAKGRIAEYKSEGYAAHGNDITPTKRTALPTVISL